MTISPSQATRKQCTECLGLNQFNRAEIEHCKGDSCYTGPCALYPFRLGKRIPIKVFRKFCDQCTGGQQGLIADCPSRSCSVYFYRKGKNPARQGIGGKGFNNKCEPMKNSQGSAFM